MIIFSTFQSFPEFERFSCLPHFSDLTVLDVLPLLIEYYIGNPRPQLDSEINFVISYAKLQINDCISKAVRSKFVIPCVVIYIYFCHKL